MRTFPNTPITNLCISGLKIHTLNWSLEIWHLPHTIMACIDKFWVFALALLLLASPLLQGLLPLFLDLDPFHLRSLHVTIIVISYWIYDKVPIFTLVLAQLFPFQLPPWALLFYCFLFVFFFSLFFLYSQKTIHPLPSMRTTFLCTPTFLYITNFFCAHTH